jgi:hypothetical protein
VNYRNLWKLQAVNGRSIRGPVPHVDENEDAYFQNQGPEEGA